MHWKEGCHTGPNMIGNLVDKGILKHAVVASHLWQHPGLQPNAIPRLAPDPWALISSMHRVTPPAGHMCMDHTKCQSQKPAVTYCGMDGVFVPSLPTPSVPATPTCTKYPGMGGQLLTSMEGQQPLTSAGCEA
jgi:hypothetical protein